MNGEMLDIKKMVNEDGYIVICDTNVLLNIYRVSPDFSDFALKCMNEMKNYIVLPATVILEYKRHYRKVFGNMRKRVQQVNASTEGHINVAKKKIMNSCNLLEGLHYPDVEELRDGLEEQLEELDKYIKDFFEDRSAWDFVANFWGTDDCVYALFEEIIGNNYECMSEVSQEEMYLWCEEGMKRYSAVPPIPPGYKDAKKKDGIRKYSDLILWKETVKYAKEKGLNVFFVTDDQKIDWWSESDGKKIFHPKLIEEFTNETGKEIIAVGSSEFYNCISDAYSIEQTSAVEMALKMTAEGYCERISDEVFCKVQFDLIYSGDYYVDSDNIGTEGIEELEIESYSFLEAEQIENDGNYINYIFEYEVVLSGTSYDYWGRDEDTREIITSPGRQHEFEGIVQIEVVREIDNYLDFENDSDFESATIVEAKIEETKCEDLLEENYLEDAYNTCPHCGGQINHENDGGNGFCSKCASLY